MPWRECLRVWEVNDARVVAGELFRKSFGGQEVPDYPRHFVLVYSPAPGEDGGRYADPGEDHEEVAGVDAGGDRLTGSCAAITHFPLSLLTMAGDMLAGVSQPSGWALPGPGEPVLITAGVFAAQLLADVDQLGEVHVVEPLVDVDRRIKRTRRVAECHRAIMSILC